MKKVARLIESADNEIVKTTGLPLGMNVTAGSATYLANLAASVKSVNSTSVTISGGTSAYLPIEYRFTIARTKKPI